MLAAHAVAWGIGLSTPTQNFRLVCESMWPQTGEDTANEWAWDHQKARFNACRPVRRDSGIARLGPVSFMGIQHRGRNTEDYNSDDVEGMARKVASEHASNHFCGFID